MIRFTLLLCLLLAPPPQPETEAEIIERIVELRRQIDELLDRLSPAARNRLERLAASSTAARGETTEAAPDQPLEPSAAVSPAAPIPAEPARPQAESRSGPRPPSPASEPMVDRPADRTSGVPPPLRIGRRSCNTLVLFDTNGDGDLTGADRQWRHLHLWLDRNGNGTAEKGEIKHLYEHGVRGLEVSLAGYVDQKGRLGDVRITDRIEVELPRRGGGDRGILMIDAERLARSSELELLSSTGKVLDDGYRPFTRGLKLRHRDGAVIELDCP